MIKSSLCIFGIQYLQLGGSSESVYVTPKSIVLRRDTMGPNIQNCVGFDVCRRFIMVLPSK
jgi:hypothetical protein